MKKGKFVLGSLLLLATGSLASCGGPEQSASEGVDSNGNWSGNLNIAIFEGGYGTAYMQNVIDGFKAKNPQVTVTLHAYQDRSTIATDWQASSEMQNNDLYFQETNDVFNAANIDHVFPNSIEAENLVELSDVYDAVPDGETTKIADKIDDQMLKYCTNQWGGRVGKRYFMSYGVTVSGIAYNHQVVDQYLTDGELPRTTDELYSLCQTIQTGQKSDKSFYPIVYAAGNSARAYWQEPFYAWWAQYDGDEAFSYFWQGRSYDEESGRWIHSPDVFRTEGRHNAFKEARRFLLKETKFTNPSTMVSYDHFSAQTQLISGHAAFMMNSGWLENEMTISMFKPEQIQGTLGLMQYPVTSAIIEKTSTISDDATLSAVIKSIDEGKDYASRDAALTNVSEADYATVEEARHTAKEASTVNFATIPTTAKSKNLAKRFLTYLYSDEGIAKYSETTPGCFLPIKNFNYDSVNAIKNSKSTFLKDCISLIQQPNHIWAYANNSIVYTGKLTAFQLNGYEDSLELTFGGSNPLTADAAFQKLIDYYSSTEAYNTLMSKADL